MDIKIFNENNLPHELFSTRRQKTKLKNALENNVSTNIKLSKTQIAKIIQSGGFSGSLISKLAGPSAKNILAPLGITAAASATDAKFQKKIHGSGITTLIISNEKMNHIMKVVRALEDSNILVKGITKTVENETKEQKGGFLGMLLASLRTNLLGNILIGKGIVRPGYGN